MKAQFDFIIGVRDKLTEIHKALKECGETVKAKIGELKKSLDKEKHKELLIFASEIFQKR